MSVNFDRLHREAAAAYAREAERRRRAGSLATEDAERLAHEVKRLGLEGQPQDAAAAIADQSVYVFRGLVMVAHVPPTSRWDLVETPGGMACRLLLWSQAEARYVFGPSFGPGEWDYVGRGEPGVPT